MKPLNFTPIPVHPWTESKCACNECKSMCTNAPCWPTPEEAQRIIDAGHGAQLMKEYRAKGSVNIDLLTPAIVGRESGNAPWWSQGRCTFLSDSGRCGLHKDGLKPLEGRTAHHDSREESFPKSPIGEDQRDFIAATWRNPAGRALVKRWQKQFQERE